VDNCRKIAISLIAFGDQTALLTGCRRRGRLPRHQM